MTQRSTTRLGSASGLGPLVLGSLVGWSIIGAFIAMFLVLGDERGADAGPWHTILTPTAQYLGWWAFLTPILLRATGTFSWGSLRWAGTTVIRIVALLGAVLTVAVLQLLLYAATAQAWAGVGSIVDLPEASMFFVGRFRENAVIGTLLVAGQLFIHSRQQAMQREIEAARLAAQLSESRLQALSMELHPHFLFNTLNAIAGMVWQDPAKADAMVLQLSELLRRTLDAGTAPTSSLAEERHVLQLYLGIQQVRFGDRLTIAVDLPATLDRVEVPRFLLQPLAENAFQHGLADKPGPISLHVEARAEAGSVVVRVLDNGVGLKPAAALVESTGIGNMRRRLAALYPNASSLTLSNRPTGGAEVLIVMPRRDLAPSSAGVPSARADRR